MITKVRTRRRKFQLSEMNSELREMKFGLREMNFELREMNFGLRELKFGLREINLSCEVLDSQSHRNPGYTVQGIYYSTVVVKIRDYYSHKSFAISPSRNKYH